VKKTAVWLFNKLEHVFAEHHGHTLLGKLIAGPFRDERGNCPFFGFGVEELKSETARHVATIIGAICAGVVCPKPACAAEHSVAFAA